MRNQGAHSRKEEQRVEELEAEQSPELREGQAPLSTATSTANRVEPPGCATPDYKDTGDLPPALKKITLWGWG